MKVGFYCRVGKVNQDDILLDKQIEYCRKYANENNITNYRIYLDKNVSGLIPFQERPMGKKLLEDIEKKEINEVVIKDFPQISRSLEDSVKVFKYLQDSEIKLRVMNTGSEMIFNMPEITKYVNTISKKLKRG